MALDSLGWRRVPVVFNNYLSHIDIIGKWEFFNPYGPQRGEGVLRHMLDNFVWHAPEEKEEGTRKKKKEKIEKEKRKENEREKEDVEFGGQLKEVALT